ncbi:MAG: hypothetical protein ACR2P1_08510 [Pseudomonadales bacterium]
MRKTSSLLILPAVVLLVSGTFSVQAYAYLDPGTGSFVLQMLVAGLLGAMLYIKMAWANVKMFFNRLLSKEEPESLLDTPEEKPEPERQQ